MKQIQRSNSDKERMKSESTFLEKANSFKGILTRELFTEAEIKNNFKGCLLRSLFLYDKSSSVCQSVNKVVDQDQVSVESSKDKMTRKRARITQP